MFNKHQINAMQAVLDLRKAIEEGNLTISEIMDAVGYFSSDESEMFAIEISLAMFSNAVRMKRESLSSESPE